MATIEAQRTRLAAVCINYGCQLGLSLAALIVVLVLVPSAKLRRAIHAVQVCANHCNPQHCRKVSKFKEQRSPFQGYP